jgi:AcrR family transcriptional regulator
VQRSRLRIETQVRQMLDAARRLIVVKGDEFTTQELVAEAGVALQTFYRYFASKDELLLAVIGDAMTDACLYWVQVAAEMTDPLERLRYFITSTLDRLKGADGDAATARFIVSTRWRLNRNYAKQLAEAEKPFVDLLREAVDAAVEAGLLKPADPQWDSWFVSELVRSVYHFYAFADYSDADMNKVKNRLWSFCLTALGGIDHA